MSDLDVSADNTFIPDEKLVPTPVQAIVSGVASIPLAPNIKVIFYL